MSLLPCFKCGKVLQPVFDDSPFDTYNQPYGGTVFRSRGHYGSTAWDPASTRDCWIEVTICDDCLVAGRAHVLEVHPKEIAQVTHDVKPWVPYGEEGHE